MLSLKADTYFAINYSFHCLYVQPTLNNIYPDELLMWLRLVSHWLDQQDK